MKSYSFSELKNETLQKLTSGLEGHGFNFDSKLGRFVRRFPDMRWSVGVDFIKHPTDFELTAGVAVGFDALEKLIFEDEREALRSYSLGVNLGHFTGEGQKRWSVRSAKDVDSTCDSVLKTVFAFGLPYLEIYSNSKEALEILSGDDRPAWLHCPIHYARAQRAVGLAFLLEDKNTFRDLAFKKTEFLTRMEDQMLQRFLDFKEKLEARLAR